MAQAAATTAAAINPFELPGRYAQATTLADLEAAFGKANVTVTASREVLLFAGDPTRRAALRFHHSAALSGLQSITVRDAGSRWRGKQGVQIGIPFAALRKANGKAFVFYGFDAQQRGWINEGWSPAPEGDDGRPGALDVAAGEHLYFGVELGFAANARALPAEALPRDLFSNSDDPRHAALVQRLVVTGFSATSSLDDDWE